MRKMADDNDDSSEKSKGIIEKMIELLLKMFGKNVGNGKGGGMPLDQAIKQPGAENHAVNILDDKMAQWACKQALKLPGLSDMAKDYLNDHPQVKEFAQKVLDNPKLKDFKSDLQERGLLDKVGLNAEKTNSQSKEKGADKPPLEMSAPKSSATALDSINSIDNYPESGPSNSEQNSAPQAESTNEMRPNSP